MLIAVFAFHLIFAQLPIQEETAIDDPPQEDSEKIVPTPKNIKEAIGIYVFVVWLWLSILVLIFILRLKIKEADRLYHLRFFPSSKK